MKRRCSKTYSTCQQVMCSISQIARLLSFFENAVNVEIYEAKYAAEGESKAKRLRAFWQMESDAVVGKVLADLLEYISFKEPDPATQAKLECARSIVARLLGKRVTPQDAEKEFLD